MTHADLLYCAEVIRRGGVVAYPTEFCYGLGCDPHNPQAVKRLLDIKRRHWCKGLILVADSYPKFNRYLDRSWSEVESTVSASWPGPTTWLIPASSKVSHWLRGRQSNLAVRLSAHRDVRLLSRFSRSALVSTSCNYSGQQPLRSVEAVISQFAGVVDYILPGHVTGGSRPSQIRNLLTGEVVRQ